MGEDGFVFPTEASMGYNSINAFGGNAVNSWNGGGGLKSSLDPSAGFGMNMGTAGMGLQGLATIGGIWNAYQSQKLAKEQFAFTKAMANTNLNNQIKSYNTALSDRSRTRGAMEGQSAAQVQSYIDTNQMTR